MGALLDSLRITPQDILRMSHEQLRQQFPEPDQQRRLIAELDAFEQGGNTQRGGESLSIPPLSDTLLRSAEGLLPGDEAPFQATGRETELGPQLGESAFNAARMVGNLPHSAVRETGNLLQTLGTLGLGGARTLTARS